MNALETNAATEIWRTIGERTKPRAILMVSAHWFVRTTAVTAMERPETIHDFGGFPQSLYDLQYPAPGEPALAARICELLAAEGAALDHSWGLDHGTWSVLVHAYPAADIPVVQLSIDGTKPAAFHYALAQRLQPLREEGVMIAGSGNVVHNLAKIRWNEPDAPIYPWAADFNAFVRDAIERNDHAALVDYTTRDSARLAVPMADHYLPLLYVLAQQRDGEAVTLPIDGFHLGGAISMLGAVVG